MFNLFEDFTYTSQTLPEAREWASDLMTEGTLTEYRVQYFNLKGDEISRPSQNCWVIESGRWYQHSEFRVTTPPRRIWWAARRHDGVIYPLFHKSEHIS